MCAENVVQEYNACDLGMERKDWLRWVLKKGQEVHRVSNGWKYLKETYFDQFGHFKDLHVKKKQEEL